MRFKVIGVFFACGYLIVAGVAQTPIPKVGPARGTVFAVGGGIVPEVLTKFLEAAGGPDALIIDVPTAGENGQFGPPASTVSPAAKWKAIGAKNVLVLHTLDRKIADSDAFVEPIKRARGVWFDGGLPEAIPQSYMGTKAEQEFRNVLERGGVVGGTSAGAVVLGTIFENGMRLRDGPWPAFTDGFNFLRNVAVDVHVRAPAPATFMSSRPDLLRIAADEPTAWVVRGDNAEIIGSGTAYVYRDDPQNPGKGYITLHPGDRYNLATHEVRRALQDSALTMEFVDSLFSDFAKPGGPAAAIFVAQQGKVLIDKSYNIPDQPQNVPTTRRNFALGEIADGFNGIAVQILASEGKISLDDPLAEGSRVTIRQYLLREADVRNGRGAMAQLIDRKAGIPPGPFGLGTAKTPHESLMRRVIGGGASLIDPNRIFGDSATGEFVGNVDYLRGWDLRLEYPITFGTAAPLDVTLGWQRDSYRGKTRLSLFGTNDGKRNAYVRIPEASISIIILTDKDDWDARAVAQRIIDKLM
jgi:cyanophycinase